MNENLKITTPRWDVAGGDIGRTGRQILVRRLIPVRPADYGGGPGFGWLVRLWLWHHVGAWLCRGLVQWEGPLRRGYAWLVYRRSYKG